MQRRTVADSDEEGDEDDDEEEMSQPLLQSPSPPPPSLPLLSTLSPPLSSSHSLTLQVMATLGGVCFRREATTRAARPGSCLVGDGEGRVKRDNDDDNDEQGDEDEQGGYDELENNQDRNNHWLLPLLLLIHWLLTKNESKSTNHPSLSPFDR